MPSPYKRRPIPYRIATFSLSALLAFNSAVPAAWAGVVDGNEGATSVRIVTDENGEVRYEPLAVEEFEVEPVAEDTATQVDEDEAPVQEPSVTPEVPGVEQAPVEQAPVTDEAVEAPVTEEAVVETGEAEAEAVADEAEQDEKADPAVEGKVVLFDGDKAVAGFDTLSAAMAQVQADNLSDAKLVCEANADLGSFANARVSNNLTIEGNGAYVTGGGCLDITGVTREFSIQVNNLGGIGLIGTRDDKCMVNATFVNCKNMTQVAPGVNIPANESPLVPGLTGLNLTLDGCTFSAAEGAKAVAVSTNARGTVVIKNCSFTGIRLPINIATKCKWRTITAHISNTTFTDCATPAQVAGNADLAAYAASIRLVAQASTFLKASVTDCRFVGPMGPNGDILVGEGRSHMGFTAEGRGEVKLTASNLDRDGGVEVQAQLPNYHGSDPSQAEELVRKYRFTSGTLLDLRKADDHVTCSLDENIAGSAAVYNGKGYGTLASAIRAVGADYKVGTAKDPVIECKEGADLGSLEGVELPGSLTIKGNGAYVTGGSLDATNAPSGTVLLVENLEGAGVSGTLGGFQKLTATFVDCQNMSEAAVAAGVGRSRLDLTLRGCSFDGAKGASDVAVNSSSMGSVTVENCTFANIVLPLNLANKSGLGVMGVSVTNTTFVGCAQPVGVSTDRADYCAPIRLVAHAGNSVNATLDGLTFEGGLGPNGDVVVGEGRSNMGVARGDGYVRLTASNLDREGGAVVQAHLEGYKNKLTVADITKMHQYVVTPEQTIVLNKEVQTITCNLDADLSVYPAVCDGEPFGSAAAALDHAAQNGGTVTLYADATLTKGVQVDREVTLDLRGHTLTAPSDLLFNVGAKGSLDVQGTDGSVALTGAGFARVAHGGALRINGVTFSGQTGGEPVVRALAGATRAGSGELAFSQVTSQTAAPFLVVDGGASQQVTVDGGEFSSEGSVFVLQGTGSAQLNDVKATSQQDYAVEAESGTVTLAGGSFSGEKGALKVDASQDGSSVVVDGGSFSGGLTVAEGANLSIEKGTFDIGLEQVKGSLGESAGVLVGNGVITVDTKEQVVEQAGGQVGDVFFENFEDAKQEAESANEPLAVPVRFSVDGIEVPTQMVTVGEKAERPADPELEGHKFTGWVNEATGEAWDFDAPVAEPLQLTASWEELPETPDVPGTDEETPDVPGDGEETPDVPGDEETPDAPGTDEETPDAPGDDQETPDAGEDAPQNPGQPGQGGSNGGNTGSTGSGNGQTTGIQGSHPQGSGNQGAQGTAGNGGTLRPAPAAEDAPLTEDEAEADEVAEAEEETIEVEATADTRALKAEMVTEDATPLSSQAHQSQLPVVGGVVAFLTAAAAGAYALVRRRKAE